jgi:hypothetical protein
MPTDPASEAVQEEQGTRLQRIALVAGSALCAINIWTGAPLFAVWVGSKLQKSATGLSMTAVFSVIVVLAVLVGLLAWALSWLNDKYDDVTGREAKARYTSPWLRSMRGEREVELRQRTGVSGVEKIVIISVVVAVLAFEIWFFFFAGSSLPNQG